MIEGQLWYSFERYCMSPLWHCWIALYTYFDKSWRFSLHSQLTATAPPLLFTLITNIKTSLRSLYITPGVSGPPETWVRKTGWRVSGCQGWRWWNDDNSWSSLCQLVLSPWVWERALEPSGARPSLPASPTSAATATDSEEQCRFFQQRSEK